jgi:hypothetical protein
MGAASPHTGSCLGALSKARKVLQAAKTTSGSSSGSEGEDDGGYSREPSVSVSSLLQQYSRADEAGRRKLLRGVLGFVALTALQPGTHGAAEGCPSGVLKLELDGVRRTPDANSCTVEILESPARRVSDAGGAEQQPRGSRVSLCVVPAARHAATGPW